MKPTRRSEVWGVGTENVVFSHGDSTDVVVFGEANHSFLESDVTRDMSTLCRLPMSLGNVYLHRTIVGLVTLSSSTSTRYAYPSIGQIVSCNRYNLCRLFTVHKDQRISTKLTTVSIQSEVLQSLAVFSTQHNTWQCRKKCEGLESQHSEQFFS